MEKKSMLPCEIFGMNGNITYECSEKDDEHSLMQWKFRMPNRETCLQMDSQRKLSNLQPV